MKNLLIIIIILFSTILNAQVTPTCVTGFDEIPYMVTINGTLEVKTISDTLFIREYSDYRTVYYYQDMIFLVDTFIDKGVYYGKVLDYKNVPMFDTSRDIRCVFGTNIDDKHFLYFTDEKGMSIEFSIE